MTGTAKLVRYVAFWLMALFGLLGGLFVAGYTFEDVGGAAAVGVTALWVVPMVVLSVIAMLRPGPSVPVFVVLTAVTAVFAVADSGLRIVPRDSWGPVGAISVFSLGVALAFLGLHRAGVAGLLMVTLALAQFAGLVVGAIGAGGSAWLGGSSGVVVVPLLVVGALFLAAGALAHEPLGLHRPSGAHPAH